MKAKRNEAKENDLNDSTNTTTRVEIRKKKKGKTRHCIEKAESIQAVANTHGQGAYIPRYNTEENAVPLNATRKIV